MLKFLRERLATLLEERKALAEAFDATMAEARSANRDLTDAERSVYDEARGALVKHDETIAEVRANLAKAEEDEKRAELAAEDEARLGVQSEERANRPATRTGQEPETYRKGGQASYFRDLVGATLHGSRDAIERLQRNDKEVRALNTSDTSGGEFVPPLWMVQEYVKLARAGSVVADQVKNLPLPGGTDSINLPKIATGTATAEQATQNSNLQDTDATTTSVSAAVATVGGKQVVSLQLIEQSPINMDDVLLADLAADYAIRKDVFVINNNAANKRGLLNVTGINAVTYTDATPTVAELYPKIADGIQQIHTGRFMPAQKIFMHPRRWATFLAAVDTQGRPLVVPAANLPQNVIAAMGDVAAEGFVGLLQGIPVYIDANIPVNLGAGTNEDRIIIARTDDVLLFEGSPRAEVFRETKAEQASVLLRFYNYLALHSERYPKSISVISGTGLVTPTF